MKILVPLLLPILILISLPAAATGQVGDCMDCDFQPWGWGCEGVDVGVPDCQQEFPGDCRLYGGNCPVMAELLLAPDGSGLAGPEETERIQELPLALDSREMVFRGCRGIVVARRYTSHKITELRSEARILTL